MQALSTRNFKKTLESVAVQAESLSLRGARFLVLDPDGLASRLALRLPWSGLDTWPCVDAQVQQVPGGNLNIRPAIGTRAYHEY